MRIEIILILVIAPMFALGLEDIDIGSINENEEIKKAIEMMESDFSHENFNYIQHFFGLIGQVDNKNINDLMNTKALMNSYKAYLSISFLQNIRKVFNNHMEKSNYYETVKTDIDVEFDELMQMMREFHESNSLDRRSKAIFIELIKQKSKNINNSIEKAIEKLRLLIKKYENQREVAFLGLLTNGVGLILGLNSPQPDKIMIALNTISGIFNGMYFIDSKLSINELDEQMTLADLKLSKIENTIQELPGGNICYFNCKSK